MIAMAMMNTDQETTAVAHSMTETREGATVTVVDTTEDLVTMEMKTKKIEVVREKEKNSVSNKDLA